MSEAVKLWLESGDSFKELRASETFLVRHVHDSVRGAVGDGNVCALFDV